MGKQYLLTALRTFRRNKVSTLINMSGLVIGICSAIVIFLIVRYDFNFDRFHEGGDRIYRVVTDMSFAGDPFPNSGVPGVLPEAMRTDITGLDDIAAFYDYNPTLVTFPNAGGKKGASFKAEPDIVFADGHFFTLFAYHWLSGTPAHALEAPNQVVLTESRAKVYFPGLDVQQVLGRTITYDDSVRAAVTGVVADLTHPTDLHYKEFVSYKTLTGQLKNTWSNDWGSITSNQQCFIRLSPGTGKAKVERELAALRVKYAKEDPKSDSHTRHSLQPLSDVHFNTTYGSMGPRTANKTALYGLLAAGIFLLLLACINYVNLTTAQAAQRAKEIGIRKTMGGTRGQLVGQFLGETLCITFLATLLGAGLTPFLLKAFSSFTPTGMTYRPFSEPTILAFLLGLVVMVSLLAGFYPAWVLAGLRPIQVLKNQGAGGPSGSRRAWLRKTLTVFQFVIAQVFILGTLLVSKQISYSIHKDLGYRKDAIIYISLPLNFYRPQDQKTASVLNALNGVPGIERISRGQSAPASDGYTSTTMTYKEGPQEIKTDVQLKTGDSNYIKVYGIRLLAGQNLRNSDTTREYLINETYAHILGFRDVTKAVGHHIGKIPIAGVVGDFHQTSLRTPIKPMAIEANNKYSSVLHIALMPETPDGNSWKKTIAAIEKITKSFYPDEEFKYTFFDETIARFYQTEQDTAKLLAWATGLSILISCLGLLGLVLFTTRLRIKEIGVRKVLGASATRIVALLSKEFVLLVGLAFAIAVPLSYLGMHKWLDHFADRTPISWWIFALGGVIILVTALATLSFQTIRAARANPVESLRAE